MPAVRSVSALGPRLAVQADVKQVCGKKGEVRANNIEYVAARCPRAAARSVRLCVRRNCIRIAYDLCPISATPMRDELA